MSVPKCDLILAEPMVRVPHKGDGFTCWSLTEAEALYESMGECIRTARHEATRLRVLWSNERIQTALSVPLDWRDGNINNQHRPFAPDSDLLFVTIDCLRATLGSDGER